MFGRRFIQVVDRSVRGWLSSLCKILVVVFGVGALHRGKVLLLFVFFCVVVRKKAEIKNNRP